MNSQTIAYVLIHIINNEINPVSSSNFRRRHEVDVSGNQDDLINDPLIRQRSYVEAYSHVNPALLHVQQKTTLSNRQSKSSFGTVS